MMSKRNAKELQSLLQEHVLDSAQTIEFFAGTVDRPDDQESPVPLTHEELQRLLKSKKFRSWPGTSPDKRDDAHKRPETHVVTVVEDKHFSPNDLAKAWGVSAELVRQLFRTEPGVLRLGEQKQQTKTRSYVTLRIPKSVAERVHKRLSAVPR
jgi:hypothetical protein